MVGLQTQKGEETSAVWMYLINCLSSVHWIIWKNNKYNLRYINRRRMSRWIRASSVENINTCNISHNLPASAVACPTTKHLSKDGSKTASSSVRKYTFYIKNTSLRRHYDWVLANRIEDGRKIYVLRRASY